jgi:hypothetical protein
LDNKFLKRHYRYLVSYLAVTSIENKPNLIDRATVFHLRMTKRYYNNKTTYEPKIKKYLTNAFKLILTVGFSGFLLAFIPLFANQNKNKELEKQIEVLIESQNKIIELLNSINEKSDTVDYTIQFEKIKNELNKINENTKKEEEKRK